MIYIDFSNGSQLLPEEKDVNQILGLRLFLRALTESVSIEGTVTEAEVSFDVTDFNNYSLSLSPLTWNGIQEVLKFFKIDKEFFQHK
jgi:hypothetical protein